MNPLYIAGGSVPGAAHTKPGKPGWTNNQDAYHWDEREGILAAVVSDGCGSGARSEVGAAVTARLTTQALLTEAARGGEPNWSRVSQEVLAELGVLARAMGGSRSELVSQYFLATVIGAVITPEWVWVVSSGDSVAFVGGPHGACIREQTVDNAPRYLAYALTDPPGAPYMLTPMHSFPRDALTYIALASDGVDDLGNTQTDTPGDVSQFWRDPRFVRYPDLIRRRLAVINRERLTETTDGGQRITSGVLADDTTVVVIRNDLESERSAEV